jgi:hypothetical protein
MAPIGEGHITASPRVAAGNMGLARIELVCIALVFHASLHGTATVEIRGLDNAIPLKSEHKSI